MKTIGLIGGMSWESSQGYYRIINEEAKHQLGGLASAQSLMFSFNFAEIEELQHAGQWDEATNRLADAAQRLERGGADFILICTNTMHKMFDEVQNRVSVPLLHIAKPTAEAIHAKGITKVGLLGTKYTMEQDFYRGWLEKNANIEVVVPDEEDRQTIHDIIYNELCLGEIKPQSKEKYVAIMQRLQAQGAQGIILGCTEISLLVSQADTSLPVFDTTRIHAEAALTMALQ